MYFTGNDGGARTQRRPSRATKVRVENGGTFLGVLSPFGVTAGSILNLQPKTTTTPTAPVTSPYVVTPAAILPPPPPPPPPPSAIAPSPTPTPTPFSPPPPTFTPVTSPPSEPSSDPVTQAAQTAAATAPILAPISPVAGAVAALAPVVAQAAQQDPTTQIRFTDDTSGGGGGLPDLSLPAVYNPDGTPATPAAQAQTIADKLKNLPTAAKVGGAVLLYFLFARR